MESLSDLEGTDLSAFLIILPDLLSSLLEKTPPDTPHILHVEFLLSREAGKRTIQPVRLTFGKK